MRVINHLLNDVHFLHSDNFNQRPAHTVIGLLVIHNISLPPNEFGGPYIKQLFTNQLDCNAHPAFKSLIDFKASAHLLIDRMGATTQFVAFNQRAWHAGKSSFAGRENCNDFSIGIELEGSDFTPFTDMQYDVLRDVIKALRFAYPAITAERIVGHQHIAPQRKTDPGPFFDWERLKATRENT